MLKTDRVAVARETERGNRGNLVDGEGRTASADGAKRLPGRILFVQGGAHGESRVGIDGGVAFLDKLDDALLVNDDVGSQSPLIGFIVLVVTLEDAVGLEHLAVHVAEGRRGDADLLGEGGVGSGAIDADAENFRIRGVDLTGDDSSLVRLT